jgi:hypothetical protein
MAKTFLILITINKRLSGTYHLLVPRTLALRSYTLNISLVSDLKSHEVVLKLPRLVSRTNHFKPYLVTIMIS